MKVHCLTWAYGVKNLPAWWKEKQDIEVSLDQIVELFETGNNVALMHDGDGILLVVDDHRFSQR